MKVKKFQLKNGLNVLLQESHKSPVVSIQMWVRTGSADERKGEEGISHFIEHLVFKGTRQFKVGEIASVIEGSGGELNAYTSFDQTVFYVTISKNFAETGLLTISEMMGFPKFDPTEVENEREVVVEEIKRGNDSLGRRASQLMFSNNYTKHPYGIPVIGYEKNVRGWPVKKISQFYKDRYSPRNMFLVVCGDFDSQEMKSAVEKNFGDIQDNKIRKVIRKKEPVLKKFKVKVEESNFEQSIAYFAWPIPGVKHKDAPALDVLSLILGQGDSSRLVKRLRIDQAVVNSVGASSFSPVDQGVFAVSMGYNKENLGKAAEIISEEIVKIVTDPISADEIKKAVINLESEEFYSLETVDGLSRKIGSLEFYFQDQKFQEKYLKAIRSITPKDLKRVAKKYLWNKNMTVSIVTNDNKKTVQSTVVVWKNELNKKIKTAKPKALISKKIIHPVLKFNHKASVIPQTEKFITKTGVNVLFRESTDGQVISVKAAALGGLRAEPNNEDGLTELLSRSWTGGTKQRTEADINIETESIAAGISASPGRNSVGLGADMLSIFERQGCDLYLDILCQPLLPAEVIEREKLIQMEQIRSRRDNPAQTCIRAFNSAIFQGHPYAKDNLGSIDSLERITKEKIQHHWQKMLTRQNLTIIVSGRANKNLWLENIEKASEKISVGERLTQTFQVSELSENVQIFEKSEKEQSHVVYGFRGVTITDKDRYVLQVIQSILAGQGGRLFIELRDKNSLAYSVSPLRQEGLEVGYFGAYIGCSPEKVEKAISMMREQFELLADKKVESAEIDRAKKYLIGRHDIDLQRTSAVAASILYDDIYGIDFNEPFHVAEKYSQVTAAQIQSLAQRLFSQKSVISIVGPRAPERTNWTSS